MTLPVMKPGDRVRITVEGKFRSRADSGMTFVLDGSDAPCGMYFDCLTAPTARVEVLATPIDPDLLLAREVCAEMVVVRDEGLKRVWQIQLRAGDHDDDKEVKIALAAIKSAKAGGKA